MAVPIIIRDGQMTWAADWAELKAAMLASGWTVSGRGLNARAVEPPGDDDPIDGAYTRLCEQVASIGGEGSDHELPDTEASMTYAPSEGAGTWLLEGVEA